MKRSMVDSILSLKEYNRFSKGIFSWVGYKTKWLEYENIERCAGVTKWNFKKLFVYAIEGFLSFTLQPLYMLLNLLLANLDSENISDQIVKNVESEDKQWYK